jgi:glycosyltransferase involved in cell wall biosynthesis
VTKKKNIVISGSNITSGGPLTIFNYFLQSFNDRSNDFKTTVFVNNKYLFPNCLNINFIEIKWYKKLIPLKFYYEYLYYYLYSRNKNIDLWISLSDCTPFVKSKTRVSYFHNAIPSYSFELFEIWYFPLLYFQKYYSRLFYKLNIEKNNFIIVQQDWFRNYVSKEFRYDLNNIIVFPPKSFLAKMATNLGHGNQHVFVCPTKAVTYKNNEVLFKSFCELPIEIQSKCVFYITISGNENRYSRSLYKKYGHLKNIIWLGQLSSEKMKSIYSKSNTLLFLSKLESWGLPLTEASSFGLNIVASNLPYAHETLSNFEKAIFIEVDDIYTLSGVLKSFILNEKPQFSKKEYQLLREPYFQTFDECIDYINSSKEYI